MIGLRPRVASRACSLLLLAACTGTPGDALGDEPAAPPSVQAQSLPTSAPTSPSTDQAVDASAVRPSTDPLVQQMRDTIGDPYAASRISFTFVFVAAGVRVASRSYDWRPTDGTLTVGEGRRTVEFTGLDATDPSSAVDHPRRNSDVWRSVAPGARPGRAAGAWTGFINDRYWLLAPALATGSDTDVTVRDDEIHVYFPSGGVTPGDRYTFVVDPQSGQVTSWSYELASGRDGAFDWLEYDTFGGLHLSQRRESQSGPFEIRFEDIVVE